MQILIVLATTSKSIDVMGVTFDSKLNWGPQVANTISKATRTLNGLKLIREYFNTKELVLYYNCEVWMIESLKTSLKKPYYYISISFEHVLHYKKTMIYTWKSTESAKELLQVKC